jgi:hypothetical protein
MIVAKPVHFMLENPLFTVIFDRTWRPGERSFDGGTA